jgi:tRNA threonylcarbamoyladenosine biosynthesis protein TsaB
LLAIDTSTGWTSVALYRDGLIAEYSWQTRDQQTKELVPAIDMLLSREQLDVKALSGVAVALGPGSFNGLRVGVSTAKALALSLNLVVAGVGTLEASAYQYAGVPLPVRPVLNGGRGQINTALFAGDHQSWRQLEGPESLTLDGLINRIDESVLLCGEIKPEWAAELRNRLGDLIYLPPIAGWARRAGFVAELGWRRLSVGEADDIVSLQPIYLRKPAITRSRRPLNFEENR